MSFPTTTFTEAQAASALGNAAAKAGLVVDGLSAIAQLQSVVANLMTGDPSTSTMSAADVTAATFGSTASETGTYTFPGALVVTTSVSAKSASIATTITATTSATNRLTQSEVTITPTTTFSVTGGGSIAGVRGGVTVSANKSFTDGFLYGAQGKITNNGTMAEASAARFAGVLGQVDLAAGTITAGQVSCLWGDFQGTTPTLTVPDQINILRLTNSIGTGSVNAAIFVYGAINYLMELGAASGPAYFGATAPSTLAKSLKIKVGSTDYYIGLYTSAS